MRGPGQAAHTHTHERARCARARGGLPRGAVLCGAALAALTRGRPCSECDLYTITKRRSRKFVDARFKTWQTWQAGMRASRACCGVGTRVLVGSRPPCQWTAIATVAVSRGCLQRGLPPPGYNIIIVAQGPRAVGTVTEGSPKGIWRSVRVGFRAEITLFWYIHVCTVVLYIQCHVHLGCVVLKTRTLSYL